MGLFDFMKNAGKALGLLNDDGESAEKLKAEIVSMDLPVRDLAVDFKSGTVTLSGAVESQEIREKVILTTGNVEGVEKVNDLLEVDQPAPEARFHTVKRGDTLSGISKKYYGNAMKYMVIFDANTPMLKDPNLIYPGQVLRIPEL